MKHLKGDNSKMRFEEEINRLSQKLTLTQRDLEEARNELQYAKKKEIELKKYKV